MPTEWSAERSRMAAGGSSRSFVVTGRRFAHKQRTPGKVGTGDRVLVDLESTPEHQDSLRDPRTRKRPKLPSRDERSQKAAVDASGLLAGTRPASRANINPINAARMRDEWKQGLPAETPAGAMCAKREVVALALSVMLQVGCRPTRSRVGEARPCQLRCFLSVVYGRSRSHPMQPGCDTAWRSSRSCAVCDALLSHPSCDRALVLPWLRLSASTLERDCDRWLAADSWRASGEDLAAAESNDHRQSFSNEIRASSPDEESSPRRPQEPLFLGAPAVSSCEPWEPGPASFSCLWAEVRVRSESVA